MCLDVGKKGEENSKNIKIDKKNTKFILGLNFIFYFKINL